MEGVTQLAIPVPGVIAAKALVFQAVTIAILVIVLAVMELAKADTETHFV